MSLALAERRARDITDVHYLVHLDIPEHRDSAVTGTVTVSFTLRALTGPLVLDFRAPAAFVRRVRLDGDSVAHRLVPDHIVIPERAIGVGPHEVQVQFRSTDASLNRNPDFLYALFVPARAHLDHSRCSTSRT